MTLSIPPWARSPPMGCTMWGPTKAGSALASPTTRPNLRWRAFAVGGARWGSPFTPRPKARRLLITADGGGSNGYRVRLWRVQLQKLADEIQMTVQVCHFPPGTSKWNKIEHRMFCHITQNWRGRPLVSREVVVNLIGNTTTAEGLRIQAQLDDNTYEAGIKVSDQELAELAIERDEFHGEWNYRLKPRNQGN